MDKFKDRFKMKILLSIKNNLATISIRISVTKIWSLDKGKT